MNGRKKTVLIMTSLVLLSTAMAGYLYTKLSGSDALNSKASALVNEASGGKIGQPSQATFKPTLTDDLNAVIDANSNVETAVSVVDLDSGQQYDAGETGVVFRAASTAKLIAAVSYLHEVEEGKATLDQRLDGTSAQQLIKQMLEVSDNDAWSTINDYLGDEQQAYANSIGLSSFTAGETNTITAADEAKLLTLLYQGKLIDTGHRSLMYAYMQQDDGTSLIKAAMPADATVYHKYGLYQGELHDTAIVKYQGRAFALVIYTKNPDNNLDDYSDRVGLIHTLSKTVLSDMTTP